MESEVIKKASKLVIILVTLHVLASCTYLEYVYVHREYARIQKAEPSQSNLRHMIDRDTYFIYGDVKARGRLGNSFTFAIAAYSSQFIEHELVDTMFLARSDTHFGLNLPEGQYSLLAYVDKDQNGVYDASEVVAHKNIALNSEEVPAKVLGQVNFSFSLDNTKHITWAENIVAPVIKHTQNSLFYPTGAIRSLDDPIFDEKMSTLGMYDPASFLEHAPIMFYALEEDLPHKIPVVFVHGIGGNPRQFDPIKNQLDPSRYKPWYFYYPSGGDLDQLADLFYQIYLSGKVVPQGNMPMIVVAHSMGGLIVREALNKYGYTDGENKLRLFVSLASPFGGHPAAALGEKRGFIVLPSWRDLNPNNKFVKQLFRNPLPDSLNHQLFYAYKNDKVLKVNENSDGVVSLSSQLHPLAQQQSNQQFGFNSGHADILYDKEMMSRLMEKIHEVKNYYPESHLKIMDLGGFDVKLDAQYTDISRYLIKSLGKYLVAMKNNVIEPISPGQSQFYEAVNLEIPAKTPLEKDFLRFAQEYPDFINP